MNLVRFNEDSTLLLMFFPIMIESRNKYKINYINLCVYLPNTAIPVLNKNTYNRRSKIRIFRNNFIALLYLQNTNQKACFEYWLQRMKGIITSNSLKSDITDEKNLQELSHISVSQSRMFEIIRQVFVGFSCK